MTLSIVIPCHNDAHTLEETLRALTEQSWPVSWEVIVADNGSTDNVTEVTAQYETRIPSIRLVNASARRGASYARNVGGKAATGEAILFCDADDIPASGWAIAMEAALRTDDFVAARLEFERLNSQGLRAARGTTQAHALQRFSFLPFSHAGGGTLGIKRSLHDAIGGFDETMLTCEDIDYCMRVQQTGAVLKLVAAAAVHYRLPGSARGIYTQASRYAEYEVYLYKKYGAGSFREWWRWRQYGRSWRFLLGRMKGLLRTSEGQTLLAWRLGRQMGLLKGSLRFGAPPVMVE